MKYYIRTTGERVLDSSYSQIEYELLIDSNHEYIDFFVDQLERIGNEDCVIIEDDCELCRNFKERIEKAIAKYPNKVINFFQWPYNAYYNTHESTDFLQNQCTYYPKNLTIELAKVMRRIHKERPNIATDQVENLALKEMNETHIKYRPCLVQHLNFDTLLNHEIEKLRTIYFIDYLDNLHLNYWNLNDNDRRKLLRELKIDIHHKRKEWERKKKWSNTTLEQP